ncbi:protein kinase domain-containing protein [Corynebacterium flavescens]|uniref:protein kinase domain-containing protein n=1 Tax=Corynebacterium flavescens TaxID=28028 RepID=UPI003FD121C9
MSSPDNKKHLQELIGDDYRLQWVIGHGGMSTVWLADDTNNDREVAIKVLRPEFSDNDEFLSRFRNEAESAESISSENVVATYDYRELEDNGRTFCFMALEYVRGESLADLLAREGALAEPLALDVMEQAAHGLAVIHRMGLVHRDIKPGNLMITQNGQVKITDFGIAKAAAAVPLTRTGMVVGTAQYVSPEQAQGMDVTPASDVYSLGVVGYEMLAGKRPFTGDSSVSVALAHISQAPEALSTTISAPARELIGISLRKDPSTRFLDGNEFALAIAAVRAGKRPPQPASAAMNSIAQEPSPTASTEMLASVAQPTTVFPTDSQRAVAPVADTRRADTSSHRAAQAAGVGTASKEHKSSKGSTGKTFGLGLLIAAVVAALAVGGFALARMLDIGGSSGESSTSTPPSSIVVTEYIEPTTRPSLPQEETPREEVTVTTTPHTPSPSPTNPTRPTSPPPEPDTPTPLPTPDLPTVTPTSPATTPGDQGLNGNAAEDFLNQVFPTGGA